MITVQAHGIALLIAASGTKGKRFIVDGSIVGLVPLNPAEDISKMQNFNYEENLSKIKNKIYSLFSLYSGQAMDKIISDIESETILSSVETLNYGLVDKII